jgi:anaphase-promoting complex subunit 11
MAFDVQIKRWHGVAQWSWGAGDDVCGICRNPFDGCPPDGRYPGDDSPVVWGTCTHAFHLQCIQKWLGAQTEQRCPICRRPWEFQAAADRGAPAAAGPAAPPLPPPPPAVAPNG